MDYKLLPSDLTYFYEDCKRCFVLKVKQGIDRPSIRLPSVFTRIAAVQKDYYSGRRTEEFCPELPPGVVKYGERRVDSQVLTFPGLESACHISGRFDIVVAFDSGSYGVIDFKTREEGEEPTAMYGRQLQAYAYALEHPAPGALELRPITKLGLLYFSPTSCELRGARQALSGPLAWVEVQRDDDAFNEFLREVVTLLDSPLPEPQTCEMCAHCSAGRWCAAKGGATPKERSACTCCLWCNYRSITRREGIE